MIRLSPAAPRAARVFVGLLSACAFARISALALALSLGSGALCTAAWAQGDAGARTARQVGRAADADGSGDVTALEWTAFLESCEPDAEGSLESALLIARLIRSQFDRDQDGLLTIDDLQEIHSARDRNGDGVIAAEELARGAAGARRGGFLEELALLGADQNADGAVDAAEWEAYLAALTEVDGGVLALSVLAQWVRDSADRVPADRNAFTPSVYMLTLAGDLDVDKSGAITLSDLESMFASLDRNSDGALAANELAFRRSTGGTAAAAPQSWRTPTEEAKARPNLIRWERSLEDAQIISKETGKPILICVNMDGETACESLAHYRYKDPEFANLTRGFVPLIVSPDRRNVRDHDDLGRRIPDPRFGRVINEEHIMIEPDLFERYFSGRRVAPRHLAVSPEGQVLFDIFLSNVPAEIDRALKEHGRFDVAEPDPAAMTEGQLLTSRYAACRAELESRYINGDERTRARLAGLALSDMRETQHPELLQMALVDPNPSIRRQAAWVLVQRPEALTAGRLSGLLRDSEGDPALRGALLATVDRLRTRGRDLAMRYQADRLHRVFNDLARASRAVDVERWRLTLPVVATPAVEESLDLVLERLAAVETRLAKRPEDPGLDLLRAELLLRCAQAQIASGGGNPTFFLEDARAGAEELPSSGRSLAVVASASYLLGDAERAGEAAAAALPQLVTQAGGGSATDVLGALVWARTNAIYAVMGRGGNWPDGWVSEVRDACEVLLLHPDGTEAQALSYVNFLGAVGAWAEQREVLERALERFTLSGDLHGRLRALALRDAGAAGLEQAYAMLPRTQDNEAALDWFAGLASLVSAEWSVQNKDMDAALASYGRSQTLFEESVAVNETFADSAAHYVCLT